MLRKRVNLFGVWIDDISLGGALLLAEKSLAENGKARSFFTPNLEMIAAARGDKRIKKLLNMSSVALPDGFSLKIIAKALGKEIVNTVPGIDFGEELFELAQKLGAGVFLLGGRRGVAKEAARRLRLRYPKLNICGTHHGYFESGGEGDVLDAIERSGPQILIVCRGFPRQESFAAKCIMGALPSIKVVACLGGALDVWSGRSERAPKLMRKIHLEWLYRVAREPKRLSRLFSALYSLQK